MSKASESRLTIAVDIDDVLFPFVGGIAEFHNQRHGTKLTADNFNTYNFVDVWGGSFEDSMKLIDDFLAMDHSLLQPIEGSIKAINRLKNHFRVVSITARNGIFEPNTVKWLSTHFPGLLDGAYFAGNRHDGRPYRSKGEICREVGVHILIDDSPHNLLSAAEYGVDGVLFGNKAWSVMDGLPPTSIKHCVDWDEVEDYIYNDWQSRRLSD